MNERVSDERLAALIVDTVPHEGDEPDTTLWRAACDLRDARARIAELEPEPHKKSIESLLTKWPLHMALPQRYKGGWFCTVQPGCNELACAGHDTFSEAVRQTMERIREWRAQGATW